MNRPEVLAPAGSMESLAAAAAGGADAVYFGGRSFNARRNADNFEDAEIGAAVSYCHARGMKAYITFNTVLFEQELPEAMRFARLVCDAGADAVIVQDPGLARLLHRAAPELRLHASTQMSVHDPDGVRLLEEMGFSRAVLARELSKAELEEIAASARMELEVFVHGALCMSVSGQCYLSAMLGGRSGNRGLCAQPCRLPFAAPGGTGHDLSLKDQSLIEQIGELSRMGIASLKIEGRMKRPEYVAAASLACAKAARGETVSPEELEALRSVFSRGGFTKGYYEGKTGRGMFGVRGHEDVLASNEALKTFQSLLNRENRRVGVSLFFSAKPGEPSLLTAKDEDGNSVSVSGAVPEPARTKALDEPGVSDRLSKTGGTPFLPERTETDIAPGLSLSAAELNRMRRQALEDLLALRGKVKPVPFEVPAFSTAKPETVENRLALRIRLQRLEQWTPSVAQSGAELIFLPAAEIEKTSGRVREFRKSGFRIGAELPRAVFGRGRERIQRAMEACKAAGITDFLCGGLGSLRAVRESGGAVHGDFGLNVTNSESLNELFGRGLASCVLSFENTMSTAARAAQGHESACGLIAYGRLPLMLLRNCPLKNGAGCSNCGGELIDRRGETFPVICDGQTSELLNSRPLWLCDRKNELYAAASFAVLRFTIESPQEVDAVLDAWKNSRPSTAEFTRGLYYRGVE